MKWLLLLLMFIGLTCCQTQLYSITQFPKNNDLITQLDCRKILGTVVGIDGPTIYDIVWLIGEINYIEKGRKNTKTGIIDKKYKYSNGLYSLADLVTEEDKINSQFEHQKEQIIAAYQITQDDPTYAQELAHWEHEYTTEKLPLQLTLSVIRADFLSKVESFIKQIRMLKVFVYPLMEEWSERHNRQDSFLREWGRMEANEKEEFNVHMDTYAKLHVFLIDLKGFLIDLIQSCPRAWQEFLDNKEIYAAKTKKH